MNVTYKIPTTKKDLTVEQYIKITELYETASRNEVEVNEYDLISVCINLPVNIVEKLPAKEYSLISESVTKLMKEDAELCLTFKHKGVKYGFINDLENMSIGEYSALDVFLQDIPKYYLQILNVLFRPIVREKTFKGFFGTKDNKYNIKTYDSDKDVSVFKDLPCTYLDGALVFFCNLKNELLSATMKYTAVEVTQMKEAETLVKNGGGIRHLIHTLQRSALDLKTYTKNLSIKYCID